MAGVVALRMHRHRGLWLPEDSDTTIVSLAGPETVHAVDLAGRVVVSELAAGLRVEDAYLALVHRGAVAVVWWSRRPAVTLGWSALTAASWDLETQAAVANSAVPCVEVSRAHADQLERLAAAGQAVRLRIQPTPNAWLLPLHGTLWVVMARVIIPVGFCGVACLSVAVMVGGVPEAWRSTRLAAAGIELVSATLLALLFACDCWGDTPLPRQVAFFFASMLPGCKLATTLLVCGRWSAHAAALESSSVASCRPLAASFGTGMAGVAGLVGLDVVVGFTSATQGVDSIVVWALCSLTTATHVVCGLYLMHSCGQALSSPAAAGGPRRQLRATARYLAASGVFILLNAACGLAVAVGNPYAVAWRLPVAAGLALTRIGMAACQLLNFVPGMRRWARRVTPVPAACCSRRPTCRIRTRRLL